MATYALSYAEVVSGDSPVYQNRQAQDYISAQIARPAPPNGPGGVYEAVQVSVPGPTHAQDGSMGAWCNGAGYIESGYSDIVNGGQPFAIEFWWMHRAADGDTTATIDGIYIGDLSGNDLATMGYQDTGNIEINPGFIYIANNYYGWSTGNFALEIWHHFCLSYDGSSLLLMIDGLVQFYVPGAAYGSPGEGSGATGSAGAVAAETMKFCGPGQGTGFQQFQIGNKPWQWAGCIAEIAIYKHSLTHEQILRHYAAAVVDQAIPAVGSYTDPHALALLADGPYAYYRLNEATGTWAADCSGNDHAAAYYGVALLGVEHQEASLCETTPDTAVLLNGATVAGILVPLYAFTGFAYTFEAIVYSAYAGTVFSNGAAGYGRSTISASIDAGLNTLTVTFGPLINVAVAITPNLKLHIVLTWDGKTCCVYINGNLISSTPCASSPGPVNTLAFGMAPSGWDTPFNGVLDEIAIYAGALLATRVLVHFQTIDGLPPAVGTSGIAHDDGQYWELRIYSPTGALLELPIDVEELTLSRALNGGAQANATIVLRRPFNDIGPGPVFQNRVLFWFWHGRIARPTDPWWAGYIQDIDQSKQKTEGKITLHCTGDMTLLDAAIVSETINPGIGGNPNLDAMDYIRYLMGTYGPPSFGTVSAPPSGFNAGPQQFSQQTLGGVIDTLLKQGRADDGLLYTWSVYNRYDLTRQLIIQADQDPNTITTVPWKWVFVEGGTSQYDLQTKYADIYNVILVTGGQDSVTGQQISAVYEDAESISAYGPIETAISVPELCSYDAALAYGEAYLDINGNPQAQGTVVLTVPDPTIVEGTWIQFWEAPGVLKEMRATTVEIKLSKARITQTISPTAPTPYLDNAIYRMGMRAQQKAISQVRLLPVNLQNLYARLGGLVSPGP